MLASWKCSHDKMKQYIKKQRHYFAGNGQSRQSQSFSSSHVWIWEFDPKESWALKNWCFVLWYLRWLLRVPWTTRRSNQSLLWTFIGRTDAEAEAPILWPSDAKSWLTGRDLGKSEGRRRSGWQVEMVRWHHRFDGHEFEQALGIGDGQEILVCCRPWGHKVSDTIEWLN